MNMRMISAFFRKSGYSLIELMVVVAALILIATFGVARYNEYNERQTVRQTADTLVSNLRLIQAKALAGEKPPGCQTLVGYTVEFALKSYSMYATCNNAGTIGPNENSLITVDLPANVNLSWGAGATSITYYAGGAGSSLSQTIDIVGLETSIPVVLSANSITIEEPFESIITIATPTPTPYVCPWPSGDPRCGDGGEIIIDDSGNEFACEASGGLWTIPGFGACPDTCANFLNQSVMGACNETDASCNCGVNECWDGASCTDNPCGGIQGTICQSGYECIYADGSTRSPSPDATGTCTVAANRLPPGTCTCSDFALTGSNCQDPNPLATCMSQSTCQCRNCPYPPGDPRCTGG